MRDENPSTVHDERKQLFHLQSIGKSSKVFSYEIRVLNKSKQPCEDFARSTLMYHPPQRQYFHPVNCNSVPRLPPWTNVLYFGFAEDSNFPRGQLSEIPSLGRHCFQTNGFSPYMTKTDQMNNAIVSKVDPLFLICINLGPVQTWCPCPGTMLGH